MPEMTARWMTMSEGFLNDGSGGSDYLRGLSSAHPTNSITRGASTAAGTDRRRLRRRAPLRLLERGTSMKVHGAVAGALMLMACADLAGCSSADGKLPPAVTSEVARDFNEGDALRTAADYTDDAQILAPQHPAVRGKDAIVAFYKANIDKYLGFENDSTWSLVRGDMAIEQGVYGVRNVRVGENVESGKYIRIWKRTSNGTWKLFRDMYSSDNETAAAVSLSPEEAPGQGLTAK